MVSFCEQEWAVQSDSTAGHFIVLSIAMLIAPFVVIVFLNASVYKEARRQINAIEVQVGGPQQQEIASRRLRDRKAAVDVAIIIATFLLCYLPLWITGICRQFVPGIDFPARQFLRQCAFSSSAVQPDYLFHPQKRIPKSGEEDVEEGRSLSRF